ncbi:MAG: zinc-ribbon domain containing protein [Bacilli bacterium]|nr:zinc-ribbon domain containing protein [Bacilli bacterium]
MDKTIVCKDCGAEFVFTEREQAFYESKQFSDPVRCKACRDARKAEKAAKEAAQQPAE